MKASMRSWKKASKHGSLCVLALMAGIVPVWAAGPPLVASPKAPTSTSPVLLPQVLGGTSTVDSIPAGSNLRKVDRNLRQLAGVLPTLDASTAFPRLKALAPSASLRSSTPYVLPLVKIDAVADGTDIGALKSALESLGLQTTSTFNNAIAGWLPVSQIEAATALPELRQAKASRRPITRAGAVLSQGDYVQGSAAVRALGSGFDGTGVTVGVLSDSYNCYAYYQQHGYSASGSDGFANNGFNVNAAMDISTGDLTSTVNVVSEQDCTDYDTVNQLPFSDEGRAILQIVHDVASGAALAFYAAPDSETDFANGILKLAQAGAKVIDDDIGYIDEPFFQDGPIAQAIDQVKAQGVAYFSSAGNNGRNSYENAGPTFPVASSSSAANKNEMLLNFDASGNTTTTVLPVTIPSLVPGEFIYFTLEWDQPYVTGAPNSPGSANALDLCITDSTSAVQSCSGANTIGGDPVDYLVYGNPATAGSNTAQVNIGLVIGLAQGAAPKLVKLVVEDDGAGATINAFATNSPTLQGHPGAAGAATVGAAFYFYTPRCGTTPAALEDFSSAGGSPILFDTSGSRLSTPVVRNKPDFVDADGGANTFLGYEYTQPFKTSNTQCQISTSYPSFFGTSAAAPHVAAAAALFLQANPSLTPDQLKTAFSSTASAMANTGSGYNYDAGAGFVQVDAAYSQLGLTPPMTSGGSTTGGTTGTTGATSSPPPASGGGGGGGAAGFAELTVLALLARRRRQRRQA
jgi:subtilisin family serine protease